MIVIGVGSGPQNVILVNLYLPTLKPGLPSLTPHSYAATRKSEGDINVWMVWVKMHHWKPDLTHAINQLTNDGRLNTGRTSHHSGMEVLEWEGPQPGCTQS